MIEYRALRIALLGAGSVGSQVAKLLLENRKELALRVGAELELVGVLVRDKQSARDYQIPTELLTTAPEALSLGADIVIEVMGGIEPARTYILQALNSGSDVITANKALLANNGEELFEAAEQVGAQLYFEALAANSIPLFRFSRCLAASFSQCICTRAILTGSRVAALTLESESSLPTWVSFIFHSLNR